MATFGSAALEEKAGLVARLLAAKVKHVQKGGKLNITSPIGVDREFKYIYIYIIFF